MSRFEIIEFAPVFVCFDHDPEECCVICRGLLIDPCVHCQKNNETNTECYAVEKVTDGKTIYAHSDCRELLSNPNKHQKNASIVSLTHTGDDSDVIAL